MKNGAARADARLRFLDYDVARYPNIVAYMKRIEERPAYRKAMALAGPDAPLKPS